MQTQYGSPGDGVNVMLHSATGDLSGVHAESHGVQICTSVLTTV